MSAPVNKVIISDVPQQCRMGDIYENIQDFLRKRDVITKVRRFRNEHGDNVPGKFEMELKDQEGESDVLCLQSLKRTSLCA